MREDRSVREKGERREGVKRNKYKGGMYIPYSNIH